MNRFWRRITSLLVLVTLLIGMMAVAPGCGKKDEGTPAPTKNQTDEAAEKAKKDAEKAADEAGKALEKAGEAVKDATK